MDILYKVLGKLGFEDRFIRIIQGLYDKPSAHIKVNDDLSEVFTLKRGCRQGCTILLVLFNLSLEILGQLLGQNENVKVIFLSGVEHRVAMFADDVSVYLGGTREIIQRNDGYFV